MPMTAFRSPLALVVAAASTVTLAGCGSGGSSTPKQAVKTETSIFISAKDCADSGKLSMQQCATLVDGAIADHIKNAKTYLSQNSCETAEGPDRCERSDERSYRPRLIAFAVTTTGTVSKAMPVYILHTSTEKGFRNGKQNFLLSDDLLVVSQKSVAVFESLKGKPSAG